MNPSANTPEFEKIEALKSKLMKGRQGYDHVHFAVYGRKPLDSRMGTIMGGDAKEQGKVVLLGRARDGHHYTIWGPVTPEQYRRAIESTNSISENRTGTTMKKTELKQLIKAIVTEVLAVKREKLVEGKAYSGYKESSDKVEHTEKIADTKTLTPTTKPVEKEEGKKLPVKDSTKNTETTHIEAKKNTAQPPANEKEESKARPVGGHAPTKDGGMKSNGLKEDILIMIREALESHRMEEMAKTPARLENGVVKGGLGIKYRKQDPKSPTGWSVTGHPQFPEGTPVEAPKLTGKNYVPKGMTGMGRPKASATTEPGESVGLDVSAEINGEKAPLEFDFLNSAWPQAKKYIESEVMALLGDAALDPQVKIGQEVYDAIEAAKEADLDGKLSTANNRIVLYFDPATKQLRAKK